MQSSPSGGGDGPERGMRPEAGGDRGTPGLRRAMGEEGCGDRASGGDWRCEGLRGPAGEDGGCRCSRLRLRAVPSMLLPLWCRGEFGMEGGVVGGTGDEGAGEMRCCRAGWWCGLGEDGRGDRQGDPARMDTGGQGEMIPGAGEAPPCWPGVGEEVAPIQWSE